MRLTQNQKIVRWHSDGTLQSALNTQTFKIIPSTLFSSVPHATHPFHVNPLPGSLCLTHESSLLGLI